MFYSHDVEAGKFNLFATFISTLLSGRNEYKNFVDGVIEETHNYAVGIKGIYNLDKDSASIVLYLSQADSPFFGEIKSSTLKKEDYERIYELLNSYNSEAWKIDY